MFTTPGFPRTPFVTWRRPAVGLGVLALTLVLAAPARPAATAAAQAKTAPAGATGSLARGEYLANKVAMCVQCHSPRDAKGVVLLSEKFRGGAIPFRSPWPESEWAHQAPSLAGLPGFTDEQILALLTEGRATGRTAPRSPMPQFRMSPEDAAAIAAYLRSL